MFAENKIHHSYTTASRKIFNIRDPEEDNQKYGFIKIELIQDCRFLQQSTTQRTL